METPQTAVSERLEEPQSDTFAKDAQVTPAARRVSPPSRKGMVKSSARVLDIFEYFQRSAKPARTSEISKALDIPNSSADELLKTLVEKGYLAFDSRSRCYSPTYKPVAMGNAIEHHFFGGRCLTDLMDDLRDSTGSTVMLAIQSDCWTQCVAIAAGGWAMPASVKEDYKFAIVANDQRGCGIGSNFGGALLATKSDLEIVDTVRRAKKIGLIDKHTSTLDKLLASVHRVREQGFSVCRSPNLLGVDSIATAFSYKTAPVPLAIGLIGHDLFGGSDSEAELSLLLRRAISRHIPSPSLLG